MEIMFCTSNADTAPSTLFAEEKFPSWSTQSRESDIEIPFQTKNVGNIKHPPNWTIDVVSCIKLLDLKKWP